MPFHEKYDRTGYHSWNTYPNNISEVKNTITLSRMCRLSKILLKLFCKENQFIYVQYKYQILKAKELFYA